MRKPQKLWLWYRCATHGGAIFNRAELGQTGVVMASETTQQKDTMKVEKLSLLVLALCIVVLVYVLVGETLLSNAFLVRITGHRP